VAIDASAVEPMMTWGVSPEHVIAVGGRIPRDDDAPDATRRDEWRTARDYMGLEQGSALQGQRVDRVFIGSCTNSRLSDLVAGAKQLRGRRVASHVEAWVVPGSEQVKKNDRGCVLRIDAPGGRVLIPADVERAVEEALLAGGADVRADVIVAGHHGSKTSSTRDFIAAVKPRAVVFSAGYRNRFGHPSPEVLARLDARVYRTDRDGAVGVVLAQDRVEIRGERQRRRRYWHDAPS
jgi:beta-lactamase superfamily II metal-dependent hydrolase